MMTKHNVYLQWVDWLNKKSDLIINWQMYVSTFFFKKYLLYNLDSFFSCDKHAKLNWGFDPGT